MQIRQAYMVILSVKKCNFGMQSSYPISDIRTSRPLYVYMHLYYVGLCPGVL